MTLDDTRIRGTLGVDDLDTKALVVRSGRRFHRRRPLPRAGSEVRAQGAKRAATGGSAARDPAQAQRARRAAHRARSASPTSTFDDVRLPVEAAGGRVRSRRKRSCSAERYDGRHHAGCAARESCSLSMNERVRDIDIGALVNAAFDTKRVTGRGDANIALNGTGNTDAEMLKSLAGKIRHQRAGRAPSTASISGTSCGAQWRSSSARRCPTRTGPVRTQFKTLYRQRYACQRRRAQRRPAHRHGLPQSARQRHARTSATRRLITALVAEVYKLPAGRRGQRDGRLKALEIPIAVTGTLADMKVRPDLGDLAQGAPCARRSTSTRRTSRKSWTTN